MFQVPDLFLEKLKCSLCDGYLNSKPVVVKDDKQICAKCYRILPHDEKEQCVREISFEAIGSCLVFPCRYHRMGCDYTFTWNNENGHESECKKRYFTFPDVVSTNKELVDDKAIKICSEESDALLSYSAKYGKIASTSLIDAEIKTGTTNLAFKKYLIEDIPNPIHLKLEGTVQFQNTRLPELHLYQELNNSVLSSGMYENIYNTIPSISSPPKRNVQCLSCNMPVEKNNINMTCLFGHISCNNCKGDMCVVCVKNLDGSSTIACKNASRGCKEILLQGEVGMHRDNCEFNEISCPIDKCPVKDVLSNLKEHLKDTHVKEILQSNEVDIAIGQKDQTLVILCYQSIFKCVYYYYGSMVEIMVVNLGSCAKASEFSFEVSVEVNKKVIKQTLGCANWNNCMLASGINFDKKDLLNIGHKKLSCVLKLKIIRLKQG